MPPHMGLANPHPTRRPIDVLHVVPSYFPTRGGIETLLEDFIPGLEARHGLTSSVLATAPDETYPSETDLNGTHIYRMSLRGWPTEPDDSGGYVPQASPETVRLVLGCFSSLRTVLRASSPRVLHIHNYSHLAVPLISIATSLTIPVLIHLHNHVEPTVPQSFLEHLSTAPRVVAVSEAVSTSVSQHTQRRGVTLVVPNSIRDPLPTAGIVRRVPHAVAMVGRLSRQKGFDEGLKALALARASVPDLTVRIVGDGPDRAHLEELAMHLGLLSVTDFLGVLDRSETLAVMAGVDVVLVPSTGPEAFSLVALEAALLEKPVVATDSGGLGATVIDGVTGRIVPPGDPNQMAAAVADSLQAPHGTEAMGRVARRSALERFSMDDYIDRLANLYVDMISDGGPREVRI